LQYRTAELERLIEKQHPPVCKRDLARTNRLPAAEKTLGGTVVMWFTKGTSMEKTAGRHWHSGKRVDTSDFH
jgi:hypothetical protein